MVEIPLIRKFGRSSSSFFERLRVRRRTLLNGYTLIVCTTGLTILAIFSVVFYRQAQTLDAIGRSSRQLQTINALVQKTRAAHAQVDQFLISGSAEDFATSSATLSALLQTIQQTLPNIDASTQYDLQGLASITQSYFNTVRSLETLIQSSGAQKARVQIQQSVQQTGYQLDQYIDELSSQTTAILTDVVTWGNVENSVYQNVLLLLIIIIFMISIILCISLVHRTTAGLDAIEQAARAVTDGNFGAQVTLSRKDEIGQLALVFNQMAGSLQTALQTEAAANEQNRRQIMKLARQERMTAILEERQRIARELHDSVKQQLFSITLAAGAALNLLDHSPALARTYLAHVQQTGSYAQSEMTTLLQEMTPLPLHNRHLEDALLQYLTPLCELHGLKLLWRVEGTNTLTIVQEHALFRTVQEAASNAVRHSKATILRVSLSFGLRTLLVIEDNGQGFDPETLPPNSTGLATMRLRLKQVGGKFDLSSTIGSGTRLEIILDLRRKFIR